MTMENGSAGFDTPSPEVATNGTGQLAPEPSAATGFESVSPQEAGQQQPSIEMLQAQIAKLEGQAEKRENDYRSLEGRLKSSSKETTQFDELSEGLAVLSDTMNAFIRHQGTQDEETFREDLQKVEANAQNRRMNSTFQRTSQLMIDEISQTVREAGLDLQTAPELEDFRNLWGPAFEGQDIAGLYQAQATLTGLCVRLRGCGVRKRRKPPRINCRKHSRITGLTRWTWIQRQRPPLLWAAVIYFQGLEIPKWL